MLTRTGGGLWVRVRARTREALGRPEQGELPLPAAGACNRALEERKLGFGCEGGAERGEVRVHSAAARWREAAREAVEGQPQLRHLQQPPLPPGPSHLAAPAHAFTTGPGLGPGLGPARRPGVVALTDQNGSLTLDAHNGSLTLDAHNGSLTLDAHNGGGQLDSVQGREDRGRRVARSGLFAAPAVAVDPVDAARAGVERDLQHRQPPPPAQKHQHRHTRTITTHVPRHEHRRTETGNRVGLRHSKGACEVGVTRAATFPGSMASKAVSGAASAPVAAALGRSLSTPHSSNSGSALRPSRSVATSPGRASAAAAAVAVAVTSAAAAAAAAAAATASCGTAGAAAAAAAVPRTRLVAGSPSTRPPAAAWGGASL